MGQLVGQQAPAFVRGRRERARAERDMPPDCVREGLNASSRPSCRGIGVNAHPRKVASETLFHERSHSGVQRLSRRTHDVVHLRGQRRHPCGDRRRTLHPGLPALRLGWRHGCGHAQHALRHPVGFLLKSVARRARNESGLQPPRRGRAHRRTGEVLGADRARSVICPGGSLCGPCHQFGRAGVVPLRLLSRARGGVGSRHSASPSSVSAAPGVPASALRCRRPICQTGSCQSKPSARTSAT